MKTKLYKKRQGAMLGGVLNGLSEYFDIDVTLLRIIYAVLAIATTGIPFVLIYIIMMLVMPEKDEIGFEDYEVE